MVVLGRLVRFYAAKKALGERWGVPCIGVYLVSLEGLRNFPPAWCVKPTPSALITAPTARTSRPEAAATKQTRLMSDVAEAECCLNAVFSYFPQRHGSGVLLKGPH